MNKKANFGGQKIKLEKWGGDPYLGKCGKCSVNSRDNIYLVLFQGLNHDLKSVKKLL